MRSFALMAIMAVASTGLQVRSDEGAPAEAPVQQPIAAPEVTLAASVEMPADDGSNVEGAIATAENNEAISAQIDDIMNKTGGDATEAQSPDLQHAMPNNYRPPPKQDQKPRERRERPNIFEHGLLKSMDLSFVGSDMADPKSQTTQQKPVSGGPIGFLSQGGAGFARNSLGGQYAGLGAGVGGYGGYGAQNVQQPGNPYAPKAPSSPYGAQQPGNPYGPQSPSGPAGPQQPGNPYGPRQPGNPYGPQSPSGPAGPQQPGNPYGPQRPSGPSAARQPGNPYGPQSPSGPYGPQQPGSPYGARRPSSPYGIRQPSSAFGVSAPASPYGVSSPFQASAYRRQARVGSRGGYGSSLGGYGSSRAGYGGNLGGYGGASRYGGRTSLRSGYGNPRSSRW